MSTTDDENPGLIPMLKELFGPINKQFKKDLEGYNISELYGPFIGLIFIMAFAVGVLGAYSTNSTSTTIAFGEAIFIWGLLSAIALFLLFVYVFIHVYAYCFKTTITLRVTLAWQIIALVISLLLTLSTNSVSYIYGGLTIFLLLLFVYPFLGFLTTQSTESTKVKITLHKLYLAITILIYIIQLIMQFAHL